MTLYGYETAEITYSSVHVHHELPAWSLATLCGMPVWASPLTALAAAASGLHWCDIMAMLYEVMLWLRYGYVMANATATESGRSMAWHDCHASQERINTSAVPRTPCVFQPLSWALPTLDSAVWSVWTGLAIHYCLLLSLCARHWVKGFTFVI